MNDKEALISQLRDVALPEVSRAPAPGWWLLLALLVLLLVSAMLYYRRWKKRLWQRQAQVELQSIRAGLGDESGTALLSRCSQLARKVALAADHREQVAALHGEMWLEKLDAICGKPEFTQGVGRLLLDQPYQKQSVLAEQDLNALFESMHVLIRSAGGYRSDQPASFNTATSSKRAT